ncbi:MAG TPA: O-antigen ligase family protein [Tepidisphaeraceae bacterium]|jgi:hypothetical protein
MHVIVLATIAVVAFAILATYGLGRTFALVYLPAVLFFYGVKEVSVPNVPNLNAFTAVGYPVLLMLPFCWREVRQLRFNVLDLFVALMFIPTSISAVLNTSLWDGISRAGDQFFVWIVPYFLGRICLQDVQARSAALKTLCVSVIVIAMLAVFEARLRPYFVSRTLAPMGLNTVAAGQVFTRFGFMRAQVTLGHSIDLGLCGTLCGTMILILAPSVGRKWTEPLPFVAIGACGVMVVSSISFTAFGAMTAAIVLYLLFQQRWLGNKLVVPAVACLLVGISLVMGEMLTRDVSERPTDKLEESAWIRAKLLQDAWPAALDAGAFGKGRYLNVSDIGSGSIDNAYLLFVMEYGWVYLACWVVLALTVAWKGTQLLRMAGAPEKRMPAAAAMAGFVASLLGMYTVYYGFVYATLVCVLMGMIASMYQLFRYPPVVAPMAAIPMPQGFPMDPRLTMAR